MQAQLEKDVHHSTALAVNDIEVALPVVIARVLQHVKVATVLCVVLRFVVLDAVPVSTMPRSEWHSNPAGEYSIEFSAKLIVG